ncbi:tyrosine-type recombinase/integrase [Nonomuraea sp. NPDC049028]|uniref:tyrosine-type recombinase/integrase n=1 Tax=Nonomuraea sp. NPDC049028 TaxID=3364348 RepID=UPI00371A69A9
MARVKDLWFSAVRDQNGKAVKKPTPKNPKNGGNPKANRWLACWTGPDGKEKTQTFSTKTAAEAHATKMEASQLEGRYFDYKKGDTLLKEYAETKWLPSQVHLRTNSNTLYEQHLKTHILPLLGNRKMGSLERSDMKSFVAAISAKLAPSTTHTVFSVLRALMQAAVDDKVIAANPCSRVPLPYIEPRVVVPLTAEQVIALADSITDRYRLAVWLGAGLGLRSAEARGLTLARVDFLRKKAHIVQQIQNGELVELKTKASKRVVPVDDIILDEINRHLAKYGTGEHDVLITNRLKGLTQRSSFNDRWQLAVEKAGLPKGTRFHDLRHFYASTLIAANLNPKVIQTRLGHATIAETMDTYGHLFPSDEDLGRGAIENMINSASGTTPELAIIP